EEERQRRDSWCEMIRGNSYACQADVAQITNDAATERIATVGQAIACDDPDDCHDPHGDEALHHDRQNVLASDQAPIKECKARCHQEDQGSADQYERGVCAIETTHERSPTPEKCDTPMCRRRSVGRGSPSEDSAYH